jgi:hypothetical protein
MANTTNYNWETPDDTDLVKDGAAAIRTLGNSVDTTTKALNPETTLGDIAYRSATSNTNTRLPIGTSGQILAVSGGVPAWINNDQGDITEVQAGTGISVASGTGPIPVITNTVATAFDAAGDLVYGTGADTFTKLSLGTAGKVLTVNSGATAPEWATPAGGGKVLQVVGATTTTATTIASATLTDTGITASITPSSATSKILVMVTAEFKHFRNGAGFSGIAAELFRGATSIADWNKTDADEFDFVQYAGSSANTYKSGTTTVIYLDSPSTTSSTTYKLQARGYDASVSVTFQQNSAISTITLLEIGA